MPRSPPSPSAIAPLRALGPRVPPAARRVGHHQHRRRRSRSPPGRCSSRARRATRSSSRWRLLAQNLPVLLFGVRGRRRRGPRRPGPAHGGASTSSGRSSSPSSRRRSSAAPSASCIVLVALFVLGTAETFADIGGQSILPRLVRREDLGIANARLSGGVLLTNQLVAPPIGALLFAIGMALPFVADAAGFALGRRARSPGSSTRSCRAGVGRAPRTGATRWPRACAGSLGHPPMRTLAITIVAFNVTFGAAWSVLVLYAQERLGMNDVGFGLITTAMAIGGIIGTTSYGAPRAAVLARRHHARRPADRDRDPPRARPDDRARGRPGDVRRVRRARVRVGHDGDRDPPARRPGRAARPGHRRLPRRRDGGHRRSARRSAACSPSSYGITAPFWFGFVGSAILVTVLWRQFDNIATRAITCSIGVLAASGANS